jgi:hypothetical protein
MSGGPGSCEGVGVAMLAGDAVGVFRRLQAIAARLIAEVKRAILIFLINSPLHLSFFEFRNAHG